MNHIIYILVNVATHFILAIELSLDNYQMLSKHTVRKIHILQSSLKLAQRHVYGIRKVCHSNTKLSNHEALNTESHATVVALVKVVFNLDFTTFHVRI